MKKYAYIGCLGFIAVITTEFGVIGILPQIAEHYKISIDKAGYLLSAFALIIALTGPFMTLLTSGIDRKKIMLTAIFMFLITGIVSSFSPPFWLHTTSITQWQKSSIKAIQKPETGLLKLISSGKTYLLMEQSATVPMHTLSE
jgi:MFS family permease